MIEHRIQAHTAILKKRRERLVKTLNNWDNRKGSDKSWVIAEVDALDFCLFLLTDLYEDPDERDKYGIEYYRVDDDVVGKPVA